VSTARIDPAFAPAAAAATDAAKRAFSRPLLVTAEAVTPARAGGDPVRWALGDPAAPSRPWERDVRFRQSG
jgi:hypothetical protein